MKSSESKRELEELLRPHVVAGTPLTPARALAVMTSFYRDRRAVDCDVTADGDMLLYQWGAYGTGEQKTFQFDLTRQFIIGPGEDEDIFQLHLTLHYPLSDEIAAIKSGNRWCGTPAELPEFEKAVTASPTYLYAASRVPQSVVIDYENAG